MPEDRPRIPIAEEPGLAGGPGPTPPGLTDETPFPLPATPETPEVPRASWSGEANDRPPEGTPHEPADVPAPRK